MPVFKTFNYRPNQYQYSEERSGQYQQSSEAFKSYENISESSEEYRKDYFRANSISNFKSNSNNMQQYFKPWTQRTSYQSTRQSYQSKKDRQASKDIKNPPKYSKSTNFNKPQHPIYNKFQKYSTNSSYQQKTYHEHEESEQNIEYDENQKNNQDNFSSNFEGFDDEGNEVYYEKKTVKEDDNNEAFIGFIEIESKCKRCGLIFASKNLLHVHIREVTCQKQLNRIMSKDSNTAVKIINSIASTKDQGFDLGFRS